MEKTDLENDKVNIEKLLKEGHTVQIKPKGYSMYPLFVPGRDEAVIAPVKDNMCLKRGDVVLYRRRESMLVMHRIWKCREGRFYLVGDNESRPEGPLSGEQIRGILVGVVRKGKYFSVRQPVYRMLSGLWLALRPIRPILSKAAAGGKRFLKIR
ncbi:MAG: S24/S26 family peptidase [Bacteroidales bacterium]|nr:S24/S26 family peptidase [Lachnoclostridium sp.]MCM1383640.1 S24/S26 family peptidase [Lachnoclostridium sp.]MCM1465722.1 S24/S26 family peptidase [Bacteroidales bacterium]